MVVIRTLGADILPGDFLLAQRNQSAPLSLAVCQVKRFLSPHQLEVVWWIEPAVATPLCPEKFENLLKCRVQELSKDVSSVICHDDVMDIAFVFSADILEELWVDVAGMTCVFFTRCENHRPFSPEIADSYPSRIWFTILGLQEKFRKVDVI
jgi:hypothetical protein